MTIKDFFKSFGRGIKQGSDAFISSFGSAYRHMLGGGAERKYLQEYRNWVYACVQARSEEVGNIQLRLLKDGEEVPESELVDLIHGVNPSMTKSQLFEATQAFLDLDGNAFWFLARDAKGKGKIREIWPLRPDHVTIMQSKTNPLQVEGYVYQSGANKVVLAPNEILHFKNFNPLGEHPFPHRGMGIVEAASWSIDTDNEARQWNFSFFKNSAKPDGVLVKEGAGAMSQDEYQRLKEQLNQEHRGTLNAHKTMVLSGGLKWQEISRSQKEMDFVEQRRFSRDEILALFRVPKSVLGIVEDVNRANAEASNYIFALRTVKPLMEQIVETLNEFLVPEFGEGLELTFDSPVPEDRIQIVAEYTAGLDKWLTRNEIRKLEGLPPSENGDTIFGPLAFQPIDHVTEEKSAPRSAEKKSGTKSGNVIAEIVSKFNEKKEPEKNQLSELAVKNYVEIWKKAFEVETEPLRKKIDIFLAAQEKEVQKNIREELKGIEVKEYQFKAAEDFLFDEDEAIEAGINLITPNLRRYVRQAGDQAFLLTGAEGAFDPSNPNTEKFIKERAKEFSETFNETTAKRLLDQVKEGLEKNETTEELSERVSQFYEGEQDFRSERAARTEVSASSNFAAQEAYQQAGAEKMQWIVVDPQDEDCISNEGEIVDIGDEFPSGDKFPPVHPQCVCTVLPVF